MSTNSNIQITFNNIKNPGVSGLYKINMRLIPGGVIRNRSAEIATLQADVCIIYIYI